MNHSFLDFKRCLDEEAAAIAAAANRIDSFQVSKALELLEKCYQKHSKIVITGVGKSGIVARKIAATFSSIGLTALYLNPVDALHGDLGIVAAKDVAVLLSNSGETEELLAILPHLKRRGTACIALVGRVDSSLAEGCDVVLDSAVNREICPLNLAPTASTAVAMAIGDALAAVWMERVGISPEDFAINHPAGSLGRQLTLTVSDLMVPVSEIKSLSKTAPLAEIILNITSGSPNHGSLGATWVHDDLDHSLLAGLITDGDLRRSLQSHDPKDWAGITADEIATKNPVTVSLGTLAVNALRLMKRSSRQTISVLPIVAEDASIHLLGLLRVHDLVKAGLTTIETPK